MVQDTLAMRLPARARAAQEGKRKTSVVHFWSCVFIGESTVYNRGQYAFPIKDKIVDILGLVALWFIMG